MTDNDSELSICWSPTIGSDNQEQETAMSERRRITLVEDEPDIRAIAEIALCDIGGYEVQVCASGSEAVAAAEAFAPANRLALIIAATRALAVTGSGPNEFPSR